MPAGSTYTPIATQTLGSAQSSVTFSSIAGTYTDLIMVINCGASSVGQSMNFTFNSDTGTNYSLTDLYGDGSSAASARASNQARGSFAYYSVPNTALEYVGVLQIMNYSNTTTFKTALSRSNRGSANNFPGAEAIVNLWRSTSAITSINLFPSAGNFTTGSTFTLYGITSA